MEEAAQDWLIPLVNIRHILFAMLSLAVVAYNLYRGRRKFAHILTVLSTFAILATFFEANATPLYITAVMLAVGKTMTFAQLVHRWGSVLNRLFMSVLNPHGEPTEVNASAPIESLFVADELRSSGKTREALKLVKEIIGANLPDLEIFEARLKLATIYAEDLGSLSKARRAIDEACAGHGIQDAHRESARARFKTWMDADSSPENAPRMRVSTISRSHAAHSFTFDFERLVETGRIGSAVECAEKHLSEPPADLKARISLSLVYASRELGSEKLARHVQRIIDHECLPEDLAPQLRQLASACEKNTRNSYSGSLLSRRLTQLPDPPPGLD